MKAQPFDDLEIFELLQRTYPDQFPDDSDDSFDSAMRFADSFGNIKQLADLLGRIAMLSMPMWSPLSEEWHHCLGDITTNSNGDFRMTAIVKRKFIMEDHLEQ